MRATSTGVAKVSRRPPAAPEATSANFARRCQPELQLLPKGGYYRENKDPLFFRGSMFFFASHPEAEIDTKTSGRGFSSVALRGFFYLALGCVLPKKQTPISKYRPPNRPVRIALRAILVWGKSRVEKKGPPEVFRCLAWSTQRGTPSVVAMYPPPGHSEAPSVIQRGYPRSVFSM